MRRWCQQIYIHISTPLPKKLIDRKSKRVKANENRSVKPLQRKKYSDNLEKAGTVRNFVEHLLNWKWKGKRFDNTLFISPSGYNDWKRVNKLKRNHPDNLLDLIPKIIWLHVLDIRVPYYKSNIHRCLFIRQLFEGHQAELKSQSYSPWSF